MTKEVYVVCLEIDYEGSAGLWLFSSLEKARKYVEDGDYFIEWSNQDRMDTSGSEYYVIIPTIVDEYIA